MQEKYSINTNAASRIRAVLASQGLSQVDLAGLLNISTATMSQKLTGKTRIGIDELYRISQFLDVSSDSLLGLKPLEVK